jgi:hypothetical protein
VNRTAKKAAGGGNRGGNGSLESIRSVWFFWTKAA